MLTVIRITPAWVRWVVGASVAALCVSAVIFAQRVHLLLSDEGEVQVDVVQDLMSAAREVMEQGHSGHCPDEADRLLKILGKDPWGNTYRYERSPTVGFVCRLYSLGADGEPGGRGIAEDIVIWIDLTYGRRVSYRLDQPPMGVVW